MLEQLTRMSVFATVVQEGSFTRAADRLGLSKSTVSKQIARLEDRLGARLLDRTTRTMRLTELGQVFYERCATIVQAAEEAELAVTSRHDVAVGELRVSVPLSLGVHYLARPMARFAARHGKLEVRIDLTDRAVDLIDEGYDAAIRVGALDDAGFVARKLAESRRLVVGSPEYFERAGEPATPAALRDHACLLYEYQWSGDVWSFSGTGGRTSVRVRGRVRSNNGDVLAQAACEGLGLALLPDFVVTPLIESGQLRAVLDQHCQSRTAIYAVYPQRRHVSAKVRLFTEFLAEYFSAAW